MRNPRFNGALLLFLGLLTMAGNTLDVLPPQAFWAGLLTYPIGGYLFLIGSRKAIAEAEARTARSLRPPVRANARAEAHAESQVDQVVNPHAATSAGRTRHVAQAAVTEQQVARDELTLRPPAAPESAEAGDDAEGFQVTTDVSFPVEIQEHDRIAEQLEKLEKLQRDGILSAEEFAVAKAKLLS